MPRVVILGGGFAGVGAARKLEDARAEVVLVDKHNYCTFQPLLYQVATALLEANDVAQALRDLFHKQPNVVVHQDTVSAVDLTRREVRFAELAPLTYDYLVLALGARVNFFGTKGAAEHAFPMYTLSDAVRLKAHVLERWEAADKNPALIEDGALNVVVVGGGPTGVESAGAFVELYRSNLAKDYPSLPQDQARLILVEAGPELFSMFKPDIRTYARGALEKRGVEVLLGEMVASVAPTRVTLKSGPSSRPTRWSGAPACREARLPSRSASSSSGETEYASSRISAWPGTRRYSLSATLPRSPTRRQRAFCRSWARSRSSPASVRERTSPGSWRARKPNPSNTTTRARWRRSAAGRQSCSSAEDGR